MITSAGIGSGIDIESIIDRLMTLEEAPVRTLEQKRSRLDVELSAYGSTKSAVNELATAARALGDASKLSPFQTSSTDELVGTATADSTAASESHEIVVTSLASTHRLASKAFASDTTDVGTGDRTFSSGANSFTVSLASGASSVRNLRDAINDAPDNDSVVASLLNVDGGTRLILSARESGSAAAISAPGPGGDLDLQETSPATDAVFSVDGFPVSSAGNTVTNVIEGVTVELAGPGTTTVTTKRNYESMRETLDEFVNQYNSLRENLQAAANGALSGDRLPRNIEATLRGIFNQPLADGANAGQTPTQLGFTFDKGGVLSIDEGRLSASQEGSLEAFIDTFTRTDTGFAATVIAGLEPYTRSDGQIAGREDGIDRRRNAIDDNIERFEYRLEKTETRLRRQFTVMDQIVGELQTTSGVLAQRLTS